MAIVAERIRTISVTRLHPVIGAEIGGVDLSRPLDAEALREIKDAWHEHTVLLFRGQSLSEARSPRGCRRSREQPGSATRRLGTT